MNIRQEIINKQLLEYKCCKCGCDGHWQDGVIALQLHHIDGNHQNNDLSNLQFLCPNCHALTDSYCKVKGGNIDVDQLLQDIRQGCSIRQALLNQGRSDGSVNYKKAYQLIIDNNIDYAFGNTIDTPTYCQNCGTIITTGAKYCKKCHALLNRKVERPDADTLLTEIATSSFVAVGRKYGVSDKAVVKWCKQYGLPTLKKDLVTLYKTKISH